MKDPRWLDKPTREPRLSRDEMARLEADLDAQQAVARMVAALEDDEPSLAWRSALNERLLDVRPAPRRPSWRVWGPAFGFAVCAGLATVVWLDIAGTHTPADPTSPAMTFEDQLVQVHDHGAAVIYFAPGSLSGPVAQLEEGSGDFHWTEEDLRAL